MLCVCKLPDNRDEQSFLFEASYEDLNTNPPFHPLETGLTALHLASHLSILTCCGVITEHTIVRRFSVSLQLIDRVHMYPSSMPDSHHEACVQFERCLGEVLQITPPTLPNILTYSHMKGIHDYLRDKYYKLRRYEHALDHLQAQCSSALLGTNMLLLCKLARYREHTKTQSDKQGMDIVSLWIRTNRDALAREGEAAVNAIKSERTLCVAMGVHGRANNRSPLHQLPTEIARWIMTMA